MSQTHVTSHFMQPNPFSSSTGTAPNFVIPVVSQTYGAPLSNPFGLGGPSHPTPFATFLDSGNLLKHWADAITGKKNDPLLEWKLAQYNGDPLQ